MQLLCNIKIFQLQSSIALGNCFIHWKFEIRKFDNFGVSLIRNFVCDISQSRKKKDILYTLSTDIIYLMSAIDTAIKNRSNK